MKIAVAFRDNCGYRLAALVIIPSRWARFLFGTRPVVEVVRLIDGDWVWDAPFGGPVEDRRLIGAIERERAACLIAKRNAELQKGVYP